MSNLQAQLVHELTCAEKIILTMLKHMTVAQKRAAGVEIEEAGIAGEGMTRYHERRAVLERATAATLHVAAPGEQTERPEIRKPLWAYTPATWRGTTGPTSDTGEIGISFDTQSGEALRVRIPVSHALDVATSIIVRVRNQFKPTKLHSEMSSGIPNVDGSPAAGQTV